MTVVTIPVMPEARFELNQRRAQSNCKALFTLLDDVKDPEIPVLSIWALGVLQNVEEINGAITITLTPTYSGCPAMSHIRQDIHTVLHAAGYDQIIIKEQLSPAWTTDWLESTTLKQLQTYGVAGPDAAICPQCGSVETTRISEFGSTACKAIWRCDRCLEPFDQFKRI